MKIIERTMRDNPQWLSICQGTLGRNGILVFRSTRAGLEIITKSGEWLDWHMSKKSYVLKRDWDHVVFADHDSYHKALHLFSRPVRLLIESEQEQTPWGWSIILTKLLEKHHGERADCRTIEQWEKALGMSLPRIIREKIRPKTGNFGAVLAWQTLNSIFDQPAKVSMLQTFQFVQQVDGVVGYRRTHPHNCLPTDRTLVNIKDRKVDLEDSTWIIYDSSGIGSSVTAVEGRMLHRPSKLSDGRGWAHRAVTVSTTVLPGLSNHHRTAPLDLLR